MRPLLWLGVGAAACGDNLRNPEDFEGGVEPIVECGYAIHTRPWAEPPVPGGDALGVDPDPRQLHLGFGGDPSTSIAMVWRTDDETTATQVRYGRVGEPRDRIARGFTFRYAAGDALVRIHEAHLCGLEPDTEYVYEAGAPGAWSPPRSFRTAPDLAVDPDAEVRVAYLGDSRGGWAALARVLAEIEARSPDLMVVTGDLVGTGTDEGAWEAFFASAPELLATVPMIAAHGNHEANAINFYSLMAMPGDEESFGFDFGALHQVVVNSDPEHRDDVSAGIADFLDADLAATGDARWTSVAMHRSLWSPSTAHGSDQTLRAAWGPILDAHQVDLVVSGHDHIFARTQPIRDEQVAEEGTIYLVTGGAGAPLYGLVDPLPDYVAVAESTFHATLVSVRRDLLSSESFRDDGSPLDSFVITRP